MTLERKISIAFNMTDESWLCHANPWSGWTRFTTVLPLLIIAFWSRVWWGKYSLFLIVIALLWVWLNPRIFPKPQSTDNWISRGVLGERVWLNRDQVPIPLHHRRIPNYPNLMAAIGGISVIWALVILNIWLVILGYTIVTFAKLWYIDRMVWLYQEMKDANSEYQSWLY